MRKKHEFTYVGEPIPKISNENHASFILLYQKSVLLALVKRGLLTQYQCERCVEAIEGR